MCCIGAVYSDRVDPDLIRSLVAQTKAAILRTSRIQHDLRTDLTPNTDSPIKLESTDPKPLSATDIEEMQSIFMLNTLSVWHGDPKQRAVARSDISLFARFIRRFRLLEPAGPENLACYSLLHHVPPNEREIKLPLPCDDAAWEARDPQQCADALGLRGPDVQAIVNVTGSRRIKQLEMNKALSALQSPVVDFQSRTTNVYSKFILMHALHAQIWLVQRQISVGSSFENYNGKAIDVLEGLPANNIYKPLSRSDCASMDGTVIQSNLSSGFHTTPIDDIPPNVTSSPVQSPHVNVILKSTTKALTKWKRAWDEDMALQYPPTLTSSRRFGFCRDAVPYYWLAQALLCPSRREDWKLAPDARLMHIMKMLQKVRGYAQTDAVQRGECLGSIGDIDDGYAIKDLTLDMKLLFRPIRQQLEGDTGDINKGTLPVYCYNRVLRVRNFKMDYLLIYLPFDHRHSNLPRSTSDANKQASTH
ncbi:hypothetical protein AJ78_08547 [Emergomyces pasteurianus Ep9510]|uniref:Uncharacterized protein n=1 Tax=Emergomyces pasteurianus Ep9510 TaxID=1447872 RepID=A0A1J9P265_9EURO|nr:hypothetical protein AJ78_08547 [Emergomyces pasteurianus Ep9510]